MNKAQVDSIKARLKDSVDNDDLAGQVRMVMNAQMEHIDCSAHQGSRLRRIEIAVWIIIAAVCVNAFFTACRSVETAGGMLSMLERIMEAFA